MSDTRDTRDIPDREVMVEPVTAGGGAHDVTGPEAAAHVADTHDAAAAHASGREVATVHDSDDAHDAHEEAPLGPVDWTAWRAAFLGIVVGAMICVLLYLAIR